MERREAHPAARALELALLGARVAASLRRWPAPRGQEGDVTRSAPVLQLWRDLPAQVMVQHLQPEGTRE